ncbi:MAG: lipid-binding SYLF domain-containing protein [Henriciella sp.]|nr:lipid-binding SYLF domain-containing protein [Henriciella sp.]
MPRFIVAIASLCLLASLPVLTVGCAYTPGGGVSKSDLDQQSRLALERLYDASPGARRVSREARSVLIFPSIVKAGLVFGGAYGEGGLIRGGETIDYYNSYSGTWGLQAGAQSYGYAVFLMNEKAEEYLDDSNGWELGVGPSIVFVDLGLSENLSTSTLKDDAYAFIFDQKGLMAGVSIEGTKITRIKAR